MMPKCNVGGRLSSLGGKTPADASPFSFTAYRLLPFHEFPRIGSTAPRLLMEKCNMAVARVGRAFINPGSPGPALF
jgi:hypothetical protein